MIIRDTSNKEYTGPNPKDINADYPEHTYELITCLINGEQKRIIQDRYLVKLGCSKQKYNELFPGAPTKSNAASDSYAKAALNDGGVRSNNITKLNNSGRDSEFQQNRREGHDDWLQSDDSTWYKDMMAEKAKEQHKNGLSDAVRDYFKNVYPGSEVQKQQSERMSGGNNIVHKPGVIDKITASWIKNHDAGLHDDPKGTRKKKYKDYPLTYQSSYELDFLELCEQLNIIDRITNAKTMKDAQYPRKYYLPDYITGQRICC